MVHLNSYAVVKTQDDYLFEHRQFPDFLTLLKDQFKMYMENLASRKKRYKQIIHTKEVQIDNLKKQIVASEQVSTNLVVENVDIKRKYEDLLSKAYCLEAELQTANSLLILRRGPVIQQIRPIHPDDQLLEFKDFLKIEEGERWSPIENVIVNAVMKTTKVSPGSEIKYSILIMAVELETRHEEQLRGKHVFPILERVLRKPMVGKHGSIAGLKLIT